MIETRTYDKQNDAGFPAEDPVVVLVVTGTYDVSRLLGLLVGASRASNGHLIAGETIARSLQRHNAGHAAVRLLRNHGGPDLSEVSAELDDATAVALLDEVAAPGRDGDPESMHGRADDVLLKAVSKSVRDAYERAKQAARWWVTS